jgi:hypothetical protein
VSRTRAAFLQNDQKKGKLPELGEGQLSPPDLSLVFQTVGADESQSKTKRVKNQVKRKAGDARSTRVSG